MRNSLAIGGLALALILSGGCNKPQTAAAKSSKTSSNRKPAPDFSLKDASGNTLKLSDLRGKVVVLNFWATWCGPCALEIPWFKEFETQYKNQGLEIVGVSMDEDGWAAIKPYIKQHEMNYRVVLGNDSVGQLYGGVESLPTTFMIDRQGRLAFPPHVGLISRNDYLHEIQELLGDEQTQSSSTKGTAAVLSVAGLAGRAATGQR